MIEFFAIYKDRRREYQISNKDIVIAVQRSSGHRMSESDEVTF